MPNPAAASTATAARAPIMLTSPNKGLLIATDMGHTEVLASGQRVTKKPFTGYRLTFSAGRCTVSSAMWEAAGHRSRDEALAFFRKVIAEGEKLVIVEEIAAPAGHSAGSAS